MRQDDERRYERRTEIIIRDEVVPLKHPNLFVLTLDLVKRVAGKCGFA